MNKERLEFSQEERLEIFKSKLDQIVAEANLSVPIIYYILKDYTNNVKDLYAQYQNQLYQSLNQKLEHNEEVDSYNKMEEKLKNENPDFKVTKVEGDK